MVSFPMLLDMNKYVAKRKRAPSLGAAVAGAALSRNNSTSSQNSAGDLDDGEFEHFLKDQMAQLRKQQQEQAQREQVAQQPPPPPGAGEAADAETKDAAGPATATDAATTDDAAAKERAAAAAAEQAERDKRWPSAEEVAELVATRGEWVYELYAVLIHSGAISGGHYYAYIKNLDSRKWYGFSPTRLPASRAALPR